MPQVGCRRQTEGVKKRRPPRPKGRSSLRGTTLFRAAKKRRLFALYRAHPRRLRESSFDPRPSEATFRVRPSRATFQPMGLPSLAATSAYSSSSTGMKYTSLIICSPGGVVNDFTVQARSSRQNLPLPSAHRRHTPPLWAHSSRPRPEHRAGRAAHTASSRHTAGASSARRSPQPSG